MISAFKHIRLSGYNLLPQSVDGKTRLTLNNSGVAYFSELSTASGILNTKIDAFSGTFQSFVNNLDATYATDAQLIAVSGALQTGINTVATNLASTGSVLNTKINSLSGTLTNNYYLKSNPSGFITSENVLYTTGNQTIVGSKTFAASRYVFSGANVIFTNNTGIVSGEWQFANRPTVNGTGVVLSGEAATPQNLASTGANLQAQINNLDSIYATDASVTTVANNLATTGSTLATNLASTGANLQAQINNLDSVYATDASVTTVANNLVTTGAANLARINSLSGTLTSTYATISNLASTGANLQAQINNLDSVYATDASVTTVANNLATTGTTLNTRINSLSGTLTGEYVRKATQQQFIVTLPLGVEYTGITFPVAFASTPNSVQVTFEPSTDVAYMVAVKNRTTAGFTAEFSDVLFETGNKLNVFASV